MVIVSVKEYVHSQDQFPIYEATVRMLEHHISAKFRESYRIASEIVIEFIAAATSLGKRIVSAGQRLIGILQKAFRRFMKVVRIGFPYVGGAKLMVRVTMIVLAPWTAPHVDESLVQIVTRALEMLARSLRLLSVPFDPSSLGLMQGAAILVVCP